jgi:Nuclear pore assembly and biogenesis
MSSDVQTVINALKWFHVNVISHVYVKAYTLSQKYILPTAQSLASRHPDLASLLLLLILLYVSLMVLRTASRWMYSLVVGIVRTAFILLLLLGTIWIIKVGQGDDKTADKFASSFQWALNKGKQVAWNAAAKGYFK